MSFRRQSALALLLPFLAANVARAEKVEALKPQGYVNDFAGVVDTPARERIAALCKEVDEKAHAQIAVVTIRSLEGVPIEEFSLQLATRWGVGHKGDNRGVLILLAITDRKYRIEVGYGLEPILPDGKVGGFGREMVPLLRQNDYGSALYYLTWCIADVIASDRGTALRSPTPAGPPQPAPEPSRTKSDRSPLGSLFLYLLVFLLMVAYWLLFSIWAAFRATLSATYLSLFGSPRLRHHGWSTLWWISWNRSWASSSGRAGWFGGMFGGGGGGGGSFGGFGGGSFGGGGSSGSW